MDRTYLRFVNGLSAERIVSELQKAQHLWPHQAVSEAIKRAGTSSGFCPEAGRRAMDALQIDASRQIGRLRRCELAQLGRAIHRHWLLSGNGLAGQAVKAG